MNRKFLKQQAKGLLKQHYWKIFILGIIVSLICFEFVGFSSEVTYSYDYTTTYTTYYLSFFGFEIPLKATPFLIAIASISSIAGILYSIFFSNVIHYGLENKLVHYALGRENEFDLFDGFRKNYKNIVITNFMVGLFVFLWCFVLIIPGIIKAYEYMYVNKILCEHPDWNWKKVLAESKRMTNGWKWEIFVLQFSFILWHLLSFVTFGISEYFVDPYVKMTHAYAYLYIKEQSLPNDMIEIIVNENNF